MALLKCGVGSKPCGKRCIPEEHRCRLNESEVTIERESSKEGIKKSKLTALAIVATAGVAAAVVATKVANQRQGQIEAGLEIPSEDFERAMVGMRNHPDVQPADEIRQELDDFYSTDPDITDVEIYRGITPEVEKQIDPLILETMEARGIDKSKITIYMCDNIEGMKDEESRAIARNSFSMMSKEGEAFIHINKAMAYPSEMIPEAVSRAQSIGMDYPSVKETSRRMLNHELTHVIQQHGKFLLTDRAYSIAEKFVLPYLNLKIDSKGIRSTQVRYTSEQYQSQYNAFSEAAQEILGKDKLTAEAGRQLAIRMEAEAWLVSEAPWLLRKIIKRGVA
jgi:hypothetical protein